MLKKKYLFIILTKFPFKDGEPFFQEELQLLSENFKHIVLVIPEGHRITDHSFHYDLPYNVSIELFETRPSFFNRLRAFMNLFLIAPSEIVTIKKKYGLKPSFFHLKMMFGFLSMACEFEYHFLKVLNKYNFNIAQTTVYSYWFFYATAGLALARNKLSKANLVTRIHGWDCFFERALRDYLPLRPFVLKKFDRIASISEKGKLYTEQKLNDSSGKVSLSRLGIDEFEFPAQIIPQKENQFKIVSIAYIDPIKQLEKVPLAISRCNTRHLSWLHIGDGPDRFKKTLIALAEKCLSDERFSFCFTGSLNRQEVYSTLRDYRPDILICTSLSEGIPVSMMEAMAHGIPVLSFDVGGVSEIVTDNVNGWLLPSDSTEDLIAQEIDKISSIPSKEFERFRKAAFQTYQENFRAVVNYKLFISEILNSDSH